jgi:hypothetical protein
MHIYKFTFTITNIHILISILLRAPFSHLHGFLIGYWFLWLLLCLLLGFHIPCWLVLLHLRLVDEALATIPLASSQTGSCHL